MSLNTKQIGDLNCLVSDSSKDKKTVLVCHGYGASKEDLAGLLPYISCSTDFNWVFPDAPLTIPIGPMMTGRAWFPIAIETLERAMVEGKDSVYQNLIPEGMDDAVNKLKALVGDLGVEEKDLIVIGFSQGSMVLTHLVLNHFSKPVAGVALLSSTLIAEPLLEKTSFSLNIFQSHGRNDEVLPLNGAKMLEGKLASLSHIVDFHEFQGGHEIPMDIINALDIYLKQRI